MSNYYTKTEVNNKITNIKIECGSIFGAGDRVGDIITITDNTYNKRWVIYTISGNTYKLFPMNNLTNHIMSNANYRDPSYINEYTKLEMYPFIHNTVLPNLRRSELNITACDLVSKSVYKDIIFKTGLTNKNIANGEVFWLNEPGVQNAHYFGYVDDISIADKGSSVDNTLGVRPLITVVR